MLKDINQVYPQEGPEQLTECLTCGTDIYQGDTYLDHVEEVFCSTDCLGKRLEKLGLAVWVHPND